MTANIAGLALAALALGLALSGTPASAQINLTPPAPPPSASTLGDVAALDQDVAKEDWGDIARRFNAISDFEHALAMANWARQRVNTGANVLIAMDFVNTSWKLGSAFPPGPNRDTLYKQSLILALYDMGVARTDGAKCHDPTAVSHRLDQFTTFWAAIFAYGWTLPPEQQAEVKAQAIELEAKTAPLRANDPILCADGMEQMQAGIAAGNAKAVPTPAGSFGKTYEVARPADFKTQFLPPEQWKTEADKRRAAMPAMIDAILRAPAPPAKPAGK